MVSTTNTNTKKMLGPFYKVYHTSNKDSKKKQYNVKEDLDRLFINDNSSKDHVTYAGYGFSGSGKTYTLIEGEENEDGSGYKRC